MATIHKRKLRSGEVVWELTHGTGRDHQRFVAGRSREEAQEVLNQFNRQMALHGTSPADDTVDNIMSRFMQYLRANRRPGTVRRYRRVLKTFHRCFLVPHHPDVTRLRQVTPAHIEEYKVLRSEGALAEPDDEAEQEREEQLWKEVQGRPTASQRKDNGKFGWLGRKRFRARVTTRTVNYELRVLYTFLAWSIRQNYVFINPAAAVERFRMSPLT